jgi:hypothetical protein
MMMTSRASTEDQRPHRHWHRSLSIELIAMQVRCFPDRFPEVNKSKTPHKGPQFLAPELTAGPAASKSSDAGFFGFLSFLKPCLE